MKRPALLSVEGLRIEFLTEAGRVSGVDRVSFDVREGEIVGLAGESGSGKTTLLHGVLRVLKPPAAVTAGKVVFRGRDVLSMDEEELRRFRWREVSLVMQSVMNALNPVMTVGRQIGDVIRSHTGLRGGPLLERVAELLSQVGIAAERMKSYPHELSGGMRQRVGIAMALALDPALILMDEPTTALDVIVQQQILERIQVLQQKLGFSILLITHDLALMLDLCSRIGILYAGRLAELADVEELARNPCHPYTQGLLRSIPSIARAPGLLRGIPGAPPDLRDPPLGCRFHPRCPQADRRCQTEEPPFLEVAKDHLAACHRVSP